MAGIWLLSTYNNWWLGFLVRLGLLDEKGTSYFKDAARCVSTDCSSDGTFKHQHSLLHACIQTTMVGSHELYTYTAIYHIFLREWRQTPAPSGCILWFFHIFAIHIIDYCCSVVLLFYVWLGMSFDLGVWIALLPNSSFDTLMNGLASTSTSNRIIHALQFCCRSMRRCPRFFKANFGRVSWALNKH